MRTWPGALFLFVLLPAPLGAIEPGTYRYAIRHSLYGDIGTHRMSVTRGQDGTVVVRHDADIAVEILSIPAYAREAEIREVWRGERLVGFASRIDDDGEILEVQANAVDGMLLIEGPDRVVRAAPDTAPDQPSIEAAIERTWFFVIETGDLLGARVVEVKDDAVEIGSTTIPATRYTFAGDRDDRVWFGPDGLWLKWQLDPGGGTVTLLREGPVP